MTSEVTGPWRNPRNLSADSAGSIHDDATAESLGFRGGTVAGNIHLVQFVPLLHDLFGDEWFATGTLSVMFRHATVDREAVRAVVSPDPSGDRDRRRVRLELDNGTVTAEGSATIGHPAPPSDLRSRDYRPVDPASLRSLAGVHAGMAFPSRPVHLSGNRQRQLLAGGLLTEPHPYYTGDSPWGGPLASPLTEVDLLTRVEADVAAVVPPGFVGMYGAIELHHHGRPVLVDTDYDVAGSVLAVSETPKTEVMWYESTASSNGEAVATMLMMTRLVKAGAP